MRIIVLGYVIRGPLGGMVWSNLQYLMGLARLGHDVYFLEDSDEYPSCYDPIKGYTDTDPNYGLEFAAKVFERIGFGTRWAYYDFHQSRWHGLCAERILQACASADLLLNLAGVNPMRSWLMEIPVRVYVDHDPAFTQIRHLTDPARRKLAQQHTRFFSFGENLGTRECTVPHDGFDWRATRQPVVLDASPVTPGPEHGRFTTVMQWQSYPALEYEGCRYGMKAESFGPYLDLPRRTGAIFELAIGGGNADELAVQGWVVRNALEPTRDPWTYQRYIQESKAEFSVAKHGYVVSRSGWFSERSVAYLACGRPVVVQETGFSDRIPTGSGLLAFSTPSEALAGIQAINSRYQFHCRAARAIAEEYFDARTVLPRLLDSAMNSWAKATDVTQDVSRTVK